MSSNDSPAPSRSASPSSSVPKKKLAQKRSVPSGLYDLTNSRVRLNIRRRVNAERIQNMKGLDALYGVDDPEDVPEEVFGPSGRYYSSTSLCCLTVTDEPRRSAIMMVESRMFEPVILFTIMANCVTMAWQSPLDASGTLKATFIENCEWAFLTIYTVELFVKVLAYGFVMHRAAYLRDNWCQLDFIVVVLTWVPIIVPSFGNYTALRAFRALRPLRALKRLPGMPVLVRWILDVIPRTGSVFMLCSFIFLVFGIVGMELFKGTLHYRCARGDVSADGSDTGVACRTDGRPDQCPDGTTCTYFDSNPNAGVMSFDSVAIGTIMLVQAITMDEWSEPMYALTEAVSEYVVIYFVLIVLIGGFFVVNLFLAVIYMEYGSSKEKLETPLVAADQRDLGTEDAVGLITGIQQSDSPDMDTDLDDKHKGLSCCDCAPPERGFRAMLATIANSTALSGLSTLLVMLNIVLMCMPYKSMSSSYGAMLEQGASLITWAFIFEMILKITALGCVGYWSDGWNVRALWDLPACCILTIPAWIRLVFRIANPILKGKPRHNLERETALMQVLDGTIVFMSIAEMIVTAVMSSGGMNLSFLRMLRMLRVLRIMRLMRSWRGLYQIVTTFLRAIPQMSNLVILIILCMFMFALLGMQLYGGIYTEAQGYSIAAACPGGVCPDGLEEKPHFHFDYSLPAMITIFIVLTGEWINVMHPVTAIVGPHASVFFMIVVFIGKFFLMNLLIAVILTEFEDDSNPLTPRRSGSPPPEQDTYRSNMTTPSPSSSRPPSPPTILDVDDKWQTNYSLCCFGPRNRFRQWCGALITHHLFDPVIIGAIIVSGICLALDTPRLDPASALSYYLAILNLFFTALFFMEMLMKVIAHGFAFTEGAYLKSIWNQVDFMIVIVSIVVLLAESVPQLRSLRILRVARVLRPLRLVSRNAGMKLIITSLFKTMPAVSNVFGVVLVIQVVFAIIGMQLFSGEMASCSDPSLLTRDECVTQSGRWSNPAIGSFDDFGSAMRLLYILSSADQWEDTLYTLMGAAGPDVAPVRNDFSLYALFPISWMFFGYIFAINLFVGVVVDNFSRMQREENGSAIMTVEQQQWASTVRTMLKLVPSKALRPPKFILRRIPYRIATSQAFDAFIMVVIVLNIIMMACDFWEIENETQIYHAYNRIMQVFTWIYYGECIIKLTGLGIEGYFGDSWCRFDFFLVVMSVADEYAALIIPLPPMLLRVLRIFRILRILRLLRHAKSLRDLIITMVLSFPSLVNVGSLLALVIFVYSVLGLQLFTFLVQRVEEGDGITTVRNFENFGSSFLLLFQCLTGDGWSAMMADAMVDPRSGRCSIEASNCGSSAAIPFFISFQVMGSFVFVNLVVAVILENFATLHNVNPDLVSSHDVEAFGEAWAEFDPDATNYILLEKLPELLLIVNRPLGLRGMSTKRATQLCMRLHLTPEKGRVAFRDVLQQLVDNNYFRSGMEFDEEEFAAIAEIPKLPLKAAETADANRSVASIDSQRNTALTPAEKVLLQKSPGEFFATKTLTQERVKSHLLQMLANARKRIAARRRGEGCRRPVARSSESAAHETANGNGKSTAPGKSGNGTRKVPVKPRAPRPHLPLPPVDQVATTPSSAPERVTHTKSRGLEPISERPASRTTPTGTPATSQKARARPAHSPESEGAASSQKSASRHSTPGSGSPTSRTLAAGTGNTRWNSEVRASATDRSHRRRVSPPRERETSEVQASTTDRSHQRWVSRQHERESDASTERQRSATLLQSDLALDNAREKLLAHHLALGRRDAEWSPPLERKYYRPFEPGWGDSRPCPIRTPPRGQMSDREPKLQKDSSYVA